MPEVNAPRLISGNQNLKTVVTTQLVVAPVAIAVEANKYLDGNFQLK